MVLTAAALLREYGASATSIDHVLAHRGAPRGSVYHHFPGGPTQLIDEAVALAGNRRRPRCFSGSACPRSGASGRPLSSSRAPPRWRRPPPKSMTCRPTHCAAAPIRIRHHGHDPPPPRPHPA
ncbi:TetR/AcrR family transcriptional regulator [Streptomyces sp. NBC_01594]